MQLVPQNVGYADHADHADQADLRG